MCSTDLLLYCLTITFCEQVLAVVNIHAFIVCQWFSHVYFNNHLATFIQYINWLNDWNKKTMKGNFSFILNKTYRMIWINTDKTQIYPIKITTFEYIVGCVIKG